MNKSITQDTQNDNPIPKTIRRFFTRFHVSSALKAVNAYKRKGIPVVEIFQYLFLLVFFNRSMYIHNSFDSPDALVDAFMDTLPALLKSKLQAS